MKGVAPCALLLFCTLFLFSCGSMPQPAVGGKGAVSSVAPKTEDSASKERTESDDAESVAIALPVPPKKSGGYFSSVDEALVRAVETGSPASLRSVLSSLKRTVSTATENEKVLFNVAYVLLQIAWPEELMTVECPAVTDVTPYLGAIESARQGVYDSSTGNVDFLTLCLPSLVLLTSKTRTDYYAESEASLTAALEKRPDSVLALYLAGTLYQRQNRMKEAELRFSEAVRLSPDCYECSFAYASVCLANGNATESLAQATRLLEKNPLRVQVLGLCAEASYRTGDLASAETYVARALQQEPDNASYVLFRAKILVAKNDFIKAASLLDVYARTDTTARDYLLLRSRIQKDWNRNVSAAIKTIEQALTLYPDDTEIMLSAATLASETGGTIAGKSAETLALQVLAVDSTNLSAMRIQVAAFMQQKNWKEAYKASAALLEKDKSGSLSTHIDICLQSAHEDEAWKLASALYAEQPQDETVQQTYIKVLVATKRTQEASRLITQLLQSAGSRMKSFLYYERSYLVSGEDAVFADLRASLTANPRNKDALFRLYSIYYQKKDWRKAQYYLKQVVALSPTDESLLALNRELDTLLAR